MLLLNTIMLAVMVVFSARRLWIEPLEERLALKQEMLVRSGDRVPSAD